MKNIQSIRKYKVVYLCRLFKHRPQRQMRGGYWYLKYSWIVVVKNKLRIRLSGLNSSPLCLSCFALTAESETKFSAPSTTLLKNRNERKRNKRGRANITMCCQARHHLVSRMTWTHEFITQKINKLFLGHLFSGFQ